MHNDQNGADVVGTKRTGVCEPGAPTMSVVAGPIVDVDAAINFLRQLADERLRAGQIVIEVTAFSSADGRGSPRHSVDLAALARNDQTEVQRVGDWIVSMQQDGWNVGYVPQPHDRRGSDAAAIQIKHVFGVIAFRADLEIRDVSQAQVKACAQILGERCPLIPSVVVVSGHGVHLYWYLNEVAWKDMTSDKRAKLLYDYESPLHKYDWTGLVARYSNETIKITADPSVTKLHQPMRLPGTTNLKDLSNPRQCYVSSSNGLRYTLEEFDLALRPRAEENCFRVDPEECAKSLSRAARDHTSPIEIGCVEISVEDVAAAKDRSRVESEPQPVAATGASAMAVPSGGVDVKDTRMETLFEILSKRGRSPKWLKDGRISARCPIHEDKRPSFNATLSADDTVLLYCHACDRDPRLKKANFAEMAKALDLPQTWFAAASMHPNAQVISCYGSFQRYVQQVARLDVPDVNEKHKLLLIMLASRVNPSETGQIYGALTQLAESVNASVRVVQDRLRDLQRVGLIDWTSGHSPDTSNEYFLRVLPENLAVDRDDDEDE